MSSFKRRVTSKQTSLPLGTRILPGPIPTYVTSTGIPSLDDILASGLPLTCTQVILAPDVHSAYGELVQKYFIAQGLSCGQDVCVIDNNAQDFVAECMWMPGGGPSIGIGTTSNPPTPNAEEDEEEQAKDHDAKIKIAWRYEQMKQFQTTVPTSSQSADDYCKVFDLTNRIPVSIIAAATSSGQLDLEEVSSPWSEQSPIRRVLQTIKTLLGEEEKDTINRKPLRICIPSLGSVQWGDVEPHEICFFLHSLRSLLRRHTHAVASISLPPYLCTEAWGGLGWIQKLGWLSDACISLSAFSGSPSLNALFPSHHGFVHIHSLPAPHTLQPPSDKFSTLRGLSSSGENNLAFKCMRKRLIFETLHLDVEGGVGERRTTPATSAIAFEGARLPDSPTEETPKPKGVDVAAVEVRLEKVDLGAVHDAVPGVVATPPKQAKAKKRVVFQSDRPDLYDF